MKAKKVVHGEPVVEAAVAPDVQQHEVDFQHSHCVDCNAVIQPGESYCSECEAKYG